MRKTLILPAALILGLGACADETLNVPLSPTTQRVGGGAAAGALTGLAIGSFSGNAGLGALIGAGVGAGGGFAYDQHRRSRQRAFNDGVAAGRASQ
ncbi:glycine zipper domain-containing protein [Roseococcus pinisoli]|uniref:Glycine zipper domain-containing protein n=1 Tax=Roseococcus pinisoli TaxID=2835040 RepID=A0ABS5QFU7_9PROT|nr:glycine zipper domain-containing protein [Roseococcus pinisoli]MBS7811413.1 hypothetical protein [Roseococcus pinisoli]